METCHRRRRRLRVSESVTGVRPPSRPGAAAVVVYDFSRARDDTRDLGPSSSELSVLNISRGVGGGAWENRTTRDQLTAVKGGGEGCVTFAPTTTGARPNAASSVEAIFLHRFPVKRRFFRLFISPTLVSPAII